MKHLLLNILNLCLSLTSVTNAKQFTVGLYQNNISFLKSKVLNISDPLHEEYAQYLTIDEINSIVSPSEENRTKVSDWLLSHNISILEDYGDAFKCEANDEEILHLFSGNPNLIPNELDNIIHLVEGINVSVPLRRKKNNKYNSNNVDDRNSGRESIFRLYNIKDNIDMSDASAVAVEYGGQSGFDWNDLEQSDLGNNAKWRNITNIVGNNLFADDETQLDVQMLAINSNNLDVWFWDSDNWLYTFAVDLMNKKNSPNVVSMSWGWAETQQCQITDCAGVTSEQYVERVNNEYVKLAARGVTILVSSGDSGAPGRTNLMCDNSDNTVNAVFPGSSPWVTSVGATYVLESSNKINWETIYVNNMDILQVMNIVTNNPDVGWTSGGGINNYTIRKKDAKWQDEVVSNYLNSKIPLPIYFNPNGRGYPDISVIGHSCPTVMNGEYNSLDGTSCSAPVMGSIVARLNQYQKLRNKPRLGFLNPLLYSMDASVFTDIVEGDNWSTEDMECMNRTDGGSDWGYKASKGWDPVYGLGTPNVEKILDWLNKNI